MALISGAFLRLTHSLLGADLDSDRVLRLRRYFTGRAMLYNQKSNLGLWAWVRRQELRAVEELLGSGTIDLLEVGCGAGYYGTQLSGRVSTYFGIDNNAAMVSAAKAQGLNVVAAELESHPLNVQYNRILFAGLLEFLPDPLNMLLIAKGSLRKDGKIVILIPRHGVRGYLYTIWHQLNGCPTFYIGEKRFYKIVESALLKVESQLKAGPLAVCYSLKKNNE